LNLQGIEYIQKIKKQFECLWAETTLGLDAQCERSPRVRRRRGSVTVARRRRTRDDEERAAHRRGDGGAARRRWVSGEAVGVGVQAMWLQTAAVGTRAVGAAARSGRRRDGRGGRASGERREGVVGAGLSGRTVRYPDSGLKPRATSDRWGPLISDFRIKNHPE
jgi:hypothetical protein